MAQTSTPGLVTMWRLGDPYVNLRPAVMASQRLVAAVTVSGTIRVLDVRHGTHLRVPPADAAYIVGDGLPLELLAVVAATPCGLWVEGNTRNSWSASMPLVAMCEVDEIDEQTLAEVEAVAAEVRGKRLPGGGHPDAHCGARYCQGPNR